LAEAAGRKLYAREVKATIPKGVGGEGSVMALPIVGDFMKRVYDDGRLGVSRADQFIRPAMMPRYDCDEEVDPDERPTEPGIAEDDNFFD